MGQDKRLKILSKDIKGAEERVRVFDWKGIQPVHPTVFKRKKVQG